MKKTLNDEYLNEADVESKFVFKYLLKEVLNIPDELVNFHYPVKITQGRKTIKKEADVVIKNIDGDKIIVIDSKSPTESLEKYFDQIDSYAFYLETPISILTNSLKIVVRKYLAGNKKETILDEEISALKENDFKQLKDIFAASYVGTEVESYPPNHPTINKYKHLCDRSCRGA